MLGTCKLDDKLTTKWWMMKIRFWQCVQPIILSEVLVIIYVDAGKSLCAVCTFTTRQHSSTWSDFKAGVRHLIMTSNQKSHSVNRCVFTWGTFLTNVIPIRFETTESLALFEEVAPPNENKKKNKKTELPQRWPRDAPYICVPWKISRVPELLHGYFCRNF